MKFMKLGSKPDTFQADGKYIRYVTSDLATDVTIIVGEVKFFLHKFPLLSKSSKLQKLVSEASEEDSDEFAIVDFPGGPKAFEICAKFCYGMIVTLNAHNVVAARCAAEYLEMTEIIDRGNLIFKIEVFLNTSIFRGWKDSIIALQTTKALLPWSEDLKVIGRCIDSIASRTSVDPSNVTWSYTHNRKLSAPDKIVEDGIKFDSVPKDWWVEDICELEIDLYKRVMIGVKAKGRMDAAVIGEALRTYAVKWLPDSIDGLISDTRTQRNKFLIETIVCLLPSDKGMGCSCSFLLKLLKVAILVGVDDLSREDLIKRISLKLYEASLKDLLLPAQAPQSTVYNIELVQCIVNRYLLHEKHVLELDGVKNDRRITDFVLGHGSLLTVGKLIDEYLAEIAHDPNLELSSFITLSQSIPESARPVHDGLYKAIDVYLKERPKLTKAEKKTICGLIDVRKLTTDASMHAAQNEHLPLRVVVQVLYFEQVRSNVGSHAITTNPRDVSQSATNTDEEWEKSVQEDCSKSLVKRTSQMKIKDEDKQETGKLAKKSSKNSRSGIQLLPSRSRRIFDRFWVIGKGHVESKSSETSGSSQSPSLAPGDTKSSGSSSRRRRHSIS